MSEELSHVSRNPIELGLPHRDPFLFVSQVEEWSPGVSAKGILNLDGGEIWFAGHFPDEPLVPGVLLAEALAQLSGIVGIPEGGQGSWRLAALKGMKFPMAARPPCQIRLESRLAGAMPPVAQFAVKALLGENVVAEGVVVLGAVAN